MRKISEEILKYQRFLITTHVEPDGDAVGSALAMLQALSGLGKEVVVCLADPVPPIYRFLPSAHEVLNEVPLGFNPECVIVLDCSELRRAGRVLDEINLDAVILMNIDHHNSNSRFGDFSIVEESAATGELVYELLGDLGVSLTHEMGISIYTAILTDTGGFRYRNTTRRSLQIAAEIVGLGINPGEIAERACESYPLERFQILGKALRNLRTSCNGKVADFFVTQKMFNGNGNSPSIVEGFVNYPREIDGVLVSVFFREKAQGKYRVSLRSKGDADVSEVAQFFGGGGHRNAAGCVVEGDFETARRHVLQKICEAVRGNKA
jgi:phosphoesterase RecJ-like protein